MGVGDSNWDTGLVLGLGYEAWATVPPAADSYRKRDSGVKLELREAVSGQIAAEPSLTLSLSDGSYQRTTVTQEPRSVRQSPPLSVVSSFSNAFPSSSVKKEKDAVSEEEEAERVSSRASDEEEGSARKKLRLTKEQSTLLEERFKEHSTLNPVGFKPPSLHVSLRIRWIFSFLSIEKSLTKQPSLLFIRSKSRPWRSN